MKFGDFTVRRNGPAAIVAEIGINHNGDLEHALALCHYAALAGCQAVKFQKRTIDKVYTAAELDRPRSHPWGTTNRELKEQLEFGQEEYDVIDRECEAIGISWFASPWDIDSVDFLERYDLPCYKIPSALLTDHQLIAKCASTGKPLIISTGMSTINEIACGIFGCGEIALMHCNSSYPAADDELNLKCIQTLRELYECPVGYSGHERGIATSVAAVALGACIIERHITLDRTMFGTDQSASLEPQGVKQLVRDIRAVEAAMGDGFKRVYDSELPAKQKLRRTTEICPTVKQ